MSNQITYDDKVDLNIATGIANKNKVTAADMNEIKTVVNSNSDYIDDLINAINNPTYTTTEGTDLSIDNTRVGKMKFEYYGNTEQQTYTGKNKMNINNYLEAYSSGSTGEIISISDARCYWAQVTPNATYTYSRDKGDRLMILGGNTQPQIGSYMTLIQDYGDSTETSITFTNGNYSYILIYSSRASSNRASWVMLQERKHCNHLRAVCRRNTFTKSIISTRSKNSYW